MKFCLCQRHCFHPPCSQPRIMSFGIVDMERRIVAKLFFKKKCLDNALTSSISPCILLHAVAGASRPCTIKRNEFPANGLAGGQMAFQGDLWPAQLASSGAEQLQLISHSQMFGASWSLLLSGTFCHPENNNRHKYVAWYERSFYFMQCCHYRSQLASFIPRQLLSVILKLGQWPF